MTSPTLAHCHFCGHPGVEMHQYDRRAFAVACAECGALGPEGPTEASAAALWNLAGAPALLLLARCEAFITGFEGDPDQPGVDATLKDIRRHIAGRSAPGTSFTLRSLRADGDFAADEERTTP